MSNDSLEEANYGGGGLFLWKEGAPSPRKGKVNKTMSKNQLEKTLFAAGSLPYVGQWDDKAQCWIIEPDYDGLTNFEVMSIKLAQSASAGNLKAIDMMFDRTMGKPKQQVETMTTQRSYTQYLEMMANEDARTESDITITTERVEDSPPVPSIYDEDEDDDDIDEMARAF